MGFRPCSIMEIIRAVEINYRRWLLYSTKSIIKTRVSLLGLYNNKLDSDDYTRSIKTNGSYNSRRPFIPRQREHPVSFGERRRTFVTIFDAHQRQYRSISGELFDEHFDDIEGVEVIRQKQLQKTGGTWLDSLVGLSSKNTWISSSVISKKVSKESVKHVS